MVVTVQPPGRQFSTPCPPYALVSRYLYVRPATVAMSQFVPCRWIKCLCPQCHVSCVPVFNSMSRKELKPWGVVVTLSMIICLFVYTGTGIHNVDEFRKQLSNSCFDLSEVPHPDTRKLIICGAITDSPLTFKRLFPRVLRQGSVVT